MNKSIDAVLACRVQGGRLYGKPLQRLIDNGITIIESLFEYLESINSIERIILAISEENENAGFIKIAEKYGYSFVLGDQKDVLGRIIKAAEQHNSEYILRVTTECPFILYEAADKIIQDCVNGNYDWASYKDAPEGTGFEIIKTEALVKSHKNGENKHRSELVTSYIFEHQDQFHLLQKELPEVLKRPEVRLTVDYAEDLVFCQQVYRNLKKDKELISVQEIISFWDEHPKLREPLETIGIDWGTGRLWE